MKTKLLTAKKALALNPLIIPRTNSILLSIMSKIKKETSKGGFYLILKDNEVDCANKRFLRNLGYQVHCPLNFLDVCVVKWNPIEMNISREELLNPISLKII